MYTSLEDTSKRIQAIKDEIGKVIVGQEGLIEGILVALLSEGHILLEGYPGLGKTVTVKTLARAIDAKFHRVQFTPDLIPADIIGFEMIEPATMRTSIHKGPIFTNLLLADEINRAPAKVQSALLEAMQERQITIGRSSYPLEKLFFVLATQNPIEVTGTYLLPEAEVDRFMLKLRVRYPSYSEERKITERQVMDEEPEVKAVFSPKEILDLRHYIAKRTPLRDDSPIVKYSTRIVRATRPEEGTDGFIKGLALYGASPRASISLAKAARAYSFIKGDDTVLPEHVQAMAYPVLRHRIILTHEAESRGVDPDEVIRDVLESVPRFE
ncbi:MAG: ATPase [Planctomycetes bacterium RIFCSPHIGHO2_02_FULL_50_42]|nr:MAG: ATPase [Planctomycetes bacterium RIFCSPHIGHO2_02_FULL_50_42]OHB91596.1 MAG: ATPase [Planctomycetes bacterium RIFCSPHIGHO2_12_FULL_51_37]OHB95238.1 MAG: ATPase [Planctomycetes bacterium RIFCSPLOWO2_02_FULL_50_16]OHC05325.1 MAG: ATPase [Planctomycetes bacterium RIFCSPLOWO2_12_FULL_50_35]